MKIILPLFITLVTVLHCQAQEDVRMPPLIIKSPKRQVVFKRDDKLELNCLATGIPEPSYTWFKDGQPLEIRDRITLNPVGSGNIAINPTFGTLDNGEYYCQAQNKYGTAKSTQITLKQADIHYTTRTDPVTKTVTVGDFLILEPFEKIDSFPEPVYGWKTVTDANTNEDQKHVVLTPRISLNPANGKLYFAYVTPEDAQAGRIYKLDVHNAIEDVTRGGSPYTINVVAGQLANRRPQLLTPAREDYSVVGLKGQNVTMKCFFSGYPTPTVTWIQPPDPPPQSRIDCTQQHHTECLIRNLEYSDAGIYKCQGRNAEGEAEARFTLLIESVPSFVVKPQSQNVTEGQDAVFTCEADAKPQADIIWATDGHVIDPSDPGTSKLVISPDRKTLTVKKVCKNCEDHTKSDLQVFQCRIANKHGDAFASAYLNVIQPTEIYETTERKVEFEANTDVMEVNFTAKARTDPLTKKQLQVAWWHSKARIYNEHGAYRLKNNDQTLLINLTGMTDKERTEYVGEYQAVAYTNYSNDTAIFELVIKGIVLPGVTVADLWWVILLILLLLLLLLLCICCCCCYKRNKGESYPVDEKEKQNGNDPEAELKDMDFHEHHRNMGIGEDWKGSKASLLPSGSMHSLNNI